MVMGQWSGGGHDNGQWMGSAFIKQQWGNREQGYVNATHVHTYMYTRICIGRHTCMYVATWHCMAVTDVGSTPPCMMLAS